MSVTDLYCVQRWTLDEVWETVYVSSEGSAAAAAWDDLVYEALSLFGGVPSPLRFVSFAVDGVGFISTHARDFRVIERA